VEFWKHEAYKIAHKITGGNPISSDLVSHVYLLVFKLPIQEKDLPRVFARYAWNQYKWRDSTFNKEYRLNEELTDINIQSDDHYEVTHAERLLDEYLHAPAENDQQLFTKEITKMVICGMTYREIKKLTGISLDTIHLAIKQFKHDLYNFNNTYADRIFQSPVDI
jgi:hypothetical protein